MNHFYRLLTSCINEIISNLNKIFLKFLQGMYVESNPIGRKPLSSLPSTNPTSTSPTSEVKQPAKRGRKSKAQQALANVSSNLNSSGEDRNSSTVAKPGRKSNVAKQSGNVNRKRLSNENEMFPQAEVYNKRVKEDISGTDQLPNQLDQQQQQFQQLLEHPRNTWSMNEEQVNYELVEAQQQVNQQLEAQQQFPQQHDATAMALQQSQAEKASLELRLNALAESKGRIEKENLGLKQELVEEKQKSDLKIQELNTTNDHLAKMSQIFSSKNAQLSLMKLNEERLILDNNKYQKEYTKMQESVMIQGEKFEAIRSTLKEVIEMDKDFCKSTCDNLVPTSDDSTVCDSVNFLLSDYFESKKRHQTDVQTTNELFKTYNDKIFSYKKTILDLVRKIKSQTEAAKIKDKQMKEMLERKPDPQVETMKRNIGILGEKIQMRDEKLKELGTALAKTKAREGQHQKLIEAIQQLKQREMKHLKDISGLKKEVLAISNMNKIKQEAGKSQEIKQLKAEMTKQAAEYYESLNKYINNLDGMKKQVNIQSLYLSICLFTHPSTHF